MRKRTSLLLTLLLSLAILTAFYANSPCIATAVNNPDGDAFHQKAQAFIEEVLPIDSTKWHIELKVDGNATDAWDRLETNNISLKNNDRVLVYFLGSMVGTADSIEVIFVIRANAFVQGVFNIDNSPTYLQTYRHSITPLSTDNITDFLTNYQILSGLDSTQMVMMLSNVDITQNTSRTSGNLTMTIHHVADSYDTTELLWMYPVGGNDVKFGVTFQKDFPVGFTDERQLPLSALTPASTPTSKAPESAANSTLVLAIAAATLAVIIIFLSIRLRNRINRRIH